MKKGQAAVAAPSFEQHTAPYRRGIKRQLLGATLALVAILANVAWIAFLGWLGGRLLSFW